MANYDIKKDIQEYLTGYFDDEYNSTIEITTVKKCINLLGSEYITIQVKESDTYSHYFNCIPVTIEVHAKASFIIKLQKYKNLILEAAQALYPIESENAEITDIVIKNAQSHISENSKTVYDTSMWKTPDKYKLFISHLTQDKDEVSVVAENLNRLGISTFVAHTDISGGKQWVNEIKNALMTMNGLLAYITPNFYDSEWTDQEIGFAMARNVPVFPVKCGADPKGFIGHIQGINCLYNDMSSVYALGQIIADQDKQGILDIYNALINVFCTSKDYRESELFFKHVQTIPEISDSTLDKIMTAYGSNPSLKDCWLLKNAGFHKWMYEKSNNKYFADKFNKKGRLQRNRQ